MPTVTFSTKFFESLALRTAVGRGMPDLRQVIVPFPLESESEERVRWVAHHVYDAVMKGLTRSGTAAREVR